MAFAGHLQHPIVRVVGRLLAEYLAFIVLQGRFFAGNGIDPDRVVFNASAG